MNRKLLILDVVLGACVIYGGFQLHSQWVAARARQAGMPGAAPKAGPPPVVSPLPRQPAVLPSGYKAIAVNTLFDPSRNPDIPVDAPPPPPPPPPPKEPPPLPSYHGMMDFGDPLGPIALMSDAGTAGHQEVHAGEMIGAFKLLSFNRQEFALEWDGRVIHARTSAGGSEKPRSAAPPVEPITTNGIIPGQAAPDTGPQPQAQGAQLGAGQDLTDTVKTCQSGDNSPNGTVSGGYVKQVTATPMGSSQCVWRAVGK